MNEDFYDNHECPCKNCSCVEDCDGWDACGCVTLAEWSNGGELPEDFDPFDV
jgi:hypothetical protein